MSNLISCKAGTIRVGQYTIGVWVESPKSGKRIGLTHKWNDRLPEGLPYRIIMETTGAAPKTHMEFSIEELQAFADLDAQRAAERLNPPPLPKPVDVRTLPGHWIVGRHGSPVFQRGYN